MQNHLNNILADLKLLEKNQSYNISEIDILFIKNTILEIIEKLMNVDLIDLKKVKDTSNLIYNLNVSNDFSELTDHISNEFYAFEFLLENELKKRRGAC